MGSTTKADLVNEIHKRVGGTKREINDIVSQFFETIKVQLENDEVIKIAGFGRFDTLHKNARPARNPRTNEAVIIPARKVPRFKLSKVFKEQLNQNED